MQLGYAHIQFASIASAEEVVRTDLASPLRLGDRTLRIDFAAGAPAAGPRKDIPPNKKLYVGLWTGTEEELRQKFPEHLREHIEDCYARMLQFASEAIQSLTNVS